MRLWDTGIRRGWHCGSAVPRSRAATGGLVGTANDPGRTRGSGMSTAQSDLVSAKAAAKGRRTGAPEASQVPHPSVEERTAQGRAARAEVPRSSHADFEPASRRPDPVELLQSQAASRVPELVPIRYGRMLVSPFTFYRGAALIMAADLASSPSSGLRAQLCGDAHLSNFGSSRFRGWRPPCSPPTASRPTPTGREAFRRSLVQSPTEGVTGR